MIFDSIKIKNYRQYLDEKIIVARPNNNTNNFTIIQGPNGAGKTNLLNAVTWCLYGTEKHLDNKQKGLPIISTVATKNMNSGDINEVEVEIILLDDDLKRIIITRSLKFRKSDDGKIKIVPESQSLDGSKLEILEEINKEMKKSTEPEYKINRLIPASLEEYFFFDGERLNAFFKYASANKIREEVFKISQLDILEKSIKHLTSVRSGYLNRPENSSSNVKKYTNELNMKRAFISNKEDEVKQNIIELETARVEEIKCDEKTKAFGGDDAVKLQSRRVVIEKDLERIGREVNTLEAAKLNHILKTAPSIFAYDPIVQTMQMIAEKVDAGFIPADIKKSFIETLLANGVCICGSDLSSNSECRDNIKDMFEQCNSISNITEELSAEEVKLKNIIRNIKKYSDDLDAVNENIRRLSKKHKSQNSELELISTSIGDDDDANQAKYWERKRKDYVNIRERLLFDIATLEERNRKSHDEIRRLETNLRKELKKESKYDDLRETLDFCNTSIEEMERIKNEIMSDFRTELERLTKKQFFELIWKKDNYIDVTIDNNYEISVTHQSGGEGIGTLSAGERQVLALSFMAALNNVSGFDVPIIIDTPLGRISKEPKLNIAKNLPNYLAGKQVILLVTEEEYSHEVQDKLSSRVGSEYRINFHEGENGAISKVIPYAE